MSTPTATENIQKQFTHHFNEQCKIVEKKGFNGKIIFGILAGAIVLTLIGLLDKYITCIIGIVLPTYWSMKAIESPEPDDDKQWLTYWTVYAVFSFFDLFAGFIMKYLPFYFVIKLVFLIWCFMPNTKGALVIYKHILVKFFKKYETKIDDKVKKVLKKGYEAAESTKEMLNENKSKIMEAGANVASKISNLTKSG